MRFPTHAGALALSLAAAAVAPAAAQSAPKLAYINSQVILDKAPGRAEAEELFNKEMTGFRGQVQRMGDSLNTMIANYTKQEATLTPAVRETRQKEIRTKQEEYQSKVSQLDQQAQQRQFELVQPIMEQIRRVLDEMRTQEGYTFIFDVGSTAGTIVAADKTLDITDKVIARLKPVTPTTAGARPAPAPAGAARPAPAGVTRPKPPTR